MTNDTTSIPTLDVIHVTLEHLGYLGEEFGASRIGPVLYGVYRQTLDGPVPQSISASLSLDVAVARLSPDHSWILFNAAPRHTPRTPPSRIYRLAVGGGTTQQLFETGHIGNFDCSEPEANRCLYSSDSEDGRELVITAFDPVAGKGKELLRIPIHPGGHGWMLSPDGSEIAFVENVGNRNQVQFFPLDKRQSHTVEIKGPYHCCTSVGWSPDSKSVYVGTEGSRTATLLHIDRKGNVVPVWQQSHDGAVGATPSPDGRHIAIGATGGGRNVWLIDNF